MGYSSCHSAKVDNRLVDCHEKFQEIVNRFACMFCSYTGKWALPIP